MENRHKKRAEHYWPIGKWDMPSYHLFKRLIKQWYRYEATGFSYVACLRSVKPKSSIQKCKPAQRTENVSPQNIVICSWHFYL